ncbi:CRISPR-associated endonuclease Cas1, partial [Thiolapillus sp.]
MPCLLPTQHLPTGTRWIQTSYPRLVQAFIRSGRVLAVKQLLNTLYVSTEGAWLRLEGETLVVMIEKEKRLQAPLHHLGGIVCIGRINLSS